MANFTPTGVEFMARGLNSYLGQLGKANKAQQQLGKTWDSVANQFRNADGTFAGSSNRLDSFGSSALSLATTMGTVVVDGILSVAGALVTLGTAAVREGSVYQKEMSNVMALTSATGTEFDALSEQAEELGRTTKFTALEAAEGMSFLAQAGFETIEILGAMPGVLDLASAANVDLGRSADIVSNILSGFNESTEETGRFVDVLSATFTSSNTNLTQLGDAMKQVAPLSAQLGISVEDTSAAIGILADAGIQGFKAGTGLRTVLTRLSAPTANAADTMEKLGISIFDTEGEMRSLPDIIDQFNRATADMNVEQRQAALSNIFNQRQLTTFSVLLGRGADDLQQFGDELRNSGGRAAEIASIQLDNLAGDVTLFQSALSGLKIDIFKELDDVLRPLVNLSTLLLENFGPSLLTVFDNVAFAIDRIIATALELTSVFARGGTAGLAETLGLTPQTVELVAKISESVSSFGQAISSFLTPALEELTSGGFLAIINTAIEFLNENFEAIEGVIIGVGAALTGAAIAATIATIATAIGTLLSPIGLLVTIVAVLGAAWADNWFGIRDTVTQALEAIQPFFEQLKESFNEFITVLLPSLDRAFNTLSQVWTENIQPALSQLLESIKAFTVALGLNETTIAGVNIAMLNLETIVAIILGAAENLTPTIAFLGETFEFLVENVAATIDKWTTLIEAFGNMTDTSTPLIDRVTALGTALADLSIPSVFQPGSPTPFELGLLGIASAVESAISEVSNFGNLIADAVRPTEKLEQLLRTAFQQSVQVFSKTVLPVFRAAGASLQAILDTFIILQTKALPDLGKAIEEVGELLIDVGASSVSAFESLANAITATVNGLGVMSNKLSTIEGRLEDVEEDAEDAEEDLENMSEVDFSGLSTALAGIISDLNDIIDLAIIAQQELAGVGGPSITTASDPFLSAATVASIPTVASPGGITNTNIEFGTVNISNGMDLAIFEERVKRVVSESVG